MRKNRPYTYLGTVTGMCRDCRELVPSRVAQERGSVFQERLCPTCGTSRALIAEDVGWYLRTVATPTIPKAPASRTLPVSAGCPMDCGPCAFHASGCTLPVFSVTNACDMRCPICFTYNRDDRAYFMSRQELRRVLDGVLERSGPVDLVNVTGGEPTLHPDLAGLLQECLRPGIGRVTVNSNGLRLARDPDLCKVLADLGVYVILSLHTLKPECSVAIHGRDVVDEKLRALENLERAGVGTTLLNVLIGGTNEDEMGALVNLAKAHRNVRSLTIQTMTYTGQGGGAFHPRVRVPLDAAARLVEEGTDGAMKREHFFPHPSAHPLCYSVAFFLRSGEGWRSLTDLIDTPTLRDLLSGGYLPRIRDLSATAFQEIVDRRWAEGCDEALMGQLRSLLAKLFPPGGLTPFERQRVAEESLLTVYLHSHMDEDTLDLGRLSTCPDQVPDADGRLMPACAYNLFYRMKDPKFWAGEKNGEA